MFALICGVTGLAAAPPTRQTKAATVAGSQQPPRSAAEQHITRHLDRIRREGPALRAFLQTFPKGADLHTHLTGAVYAESYVLWAADMSLCIDLGTLAYVEAEPAASPPAVIAPGARPKAACRDGSTQRPASDALRDPALYRRMVDALSARHWHAARTAGHYQFFDTFQRFGAVAREGRDASPQIVAKSVAEVAHRAASQNVLHLELMMAFDGVADATAAVPVDEEVFGQLRERLLAGGLRNRVKERQQWLDLVEREVRVILACDGASRRSACGTSIRYIPYALRGLPPPQVFAQAVFAFELAASDRRIAGVNLVMPEDWFIPMRDYELHMRIYRYLRQEYPTVNVALHAGELAIGLVPPETLGVHVRQAIEIAGAQRIGHGTDIMHDRRPAELMREMARRGIAVEISVSSSDLILGVRGARHPLRQFLRAGVPVVIATDDEGVARSDLTNEYQRGVEEQGLTYPELKEISRNSIQYSFLAPDEKTRLRRQLEAAFASFEAAVLREARVAR